MSDIPQSKDYRSITDWSIALDKYFGNKDDQITALQSSLKEKEKECEELKDHAETWERTAMSYRKVAEEQSKQIEEWKSKYSKAILHRDLSIEELKAEKERLKGLIFNMHSFYKTGEFTAEQIAGQWQDFKKQNNL